MQMTMAGSDAMKTALRGALSTMSSNPSSCSPGYASLHDSPYTLKLARQVSLVEWTGLSQCLLRRNAVVRQGNDDAIMKR